MYWISSRLSPPQFMKMNADSIESEKTSSYIPADCRMVEVGTFRKLEERH